MARRQGGGRLRRIAASALAQAVGAAGCGGSDVGSGAVGHAVEGAGGGDATDAGTASDGAGGAADAPAGSDVAAPPLLPCVPATAPSDGATRGARTVWTSPGIASVPCDKSFSRIRPWCRTGH